MTLSVDFPERGWPHLRNGSVSFDSLPVCTLLFPSVMPGPHSQKFWVHSAVGRSMDIGILYPLPRDTTVQLILKTQAQDQSELGSMSSWWVVNVNFSAHPQRKYSTIWIFPFRWRQLLWGVGGDGGWISAIILWALGFTRRLWSSWNPLRLRWQISLAGVLDIKRPLSGP